jgi:2'-5' RNA ligase
MDTQAYESVWNTFINGDHISEGAIWGGEGLALIVPIEQPELLSKIQKLQSEICTVIPFEPHLPETLHITISLFGNPSSIAIPELVDFLLEKIAPFPPFEVQIMGVNSFFRCPFLEVHDGGIISSVASTLKPGLRELGYPIFDYGPRGQIFHVTLGAYTQDGDGINVRELLKQLRPTDFGKIHVDELRLVRTSAGKPYRLFNMEIYQLGFKSKL